MSHKQAQCPLEDKKPTFPLAKMPEMFVPSSLSKVRIVSSCDNTFATVVSKL